MSAGERNFRKLHLIFQYRIFEIALFKLVQDKLYVCRSIDEIFRIGCRFHALQHSRPVTSRVLPNAGITSRMLHEHAQVAVLRPVIAKVNSRLA